MTISRWIAVAAICLTVPAAAQQQGNQPTPPSNEWEKLPKMQLELVFAGPLRDTIIQRWRDTTDNTLCYLYLPITAPHSQPVPPGFVQYGSATIGSISCFAATTPNPAAAKQPPRPPAPKANPAPAPAPKQ